MHLPTSLPSRPPGRAIVSLLVAGLLLTAACGDGEGSIGDRLPELPRPTTTEAGGGGEAAEPTTTAAPEEPTTTEAGGGGEAAETTTTAAPETTTTAPPEPTTTAAPDAPTTTVAGPADDDGDEGDDGGGVPWLLLAILAVVAVGVGVLLSRRSSAPTAPTAPTAPSPRSQLLGSLQWAHDQLSLELLAAPGPVAAERWRTERERLAAMAISAQQLAADMVPTDPRTQTWRDLATAASNLATSLDTAVSLRAAPDVDPSVVSEGIAVVQRHRAELLDLLGRAHADDQT